MKPPHLILRFAALAALALGSSGCGGDESIRTSTAPHRAQPTVKDPPTRPPMPTEGGQYRLLGAMFPPDKPIWFFKLTGPASEVEKFAADFDTFAASVQVKDTTTLPGFTLPAGWYRGGPREGFVRVAETIRFPGSTLELTIIQATGDTAGNVTRWMGQVGQTGDPAKFSQTFDAVGVKGLRVDVTGPKNPVGAPMMPGKR